jgi:hypothetical protein
METAIKAMGYKTQVQPLSYFHDDYGLEGDDGEEESEEDDEGDDDASGSESAGDSDDE